MRYLICILFVFCASNSFSQNKVKLLNAGNKEFQKGNFEKADSLYQKSKEKDNLYYKAHINAGHAKLNQARESNSAEKKDSLANLAEKLYQESAMLTENKTEKSESYYNEGNAQLFSNKLEEAIESYKRSLRLEPTNNSAKYNLARAQELLNKKEGEEKEKEGEEKEKEGEKKEKEGEKKEKEGEEKEGEEKEKEEKEKKGEEKKQELSKDAIQNILDALRRKEKEVQGDLPPQPIRGNKLEDW